MARRWLTVFCLSAALAFDCAGPAPISALTAQTSVAEFTRHSDIIYGRKYGVALTLERFAPARSDGLGVVWVVSSNGR